MIENDISVEKRHGMTVYRIVFERFRLDEFWNTIDGKKSICAQRVVLCRHKIDFRQNSIGNLFVLVVVDLLVDHGREC